jgi:hypothetical protein
VHPLFWGRVRSEGGARCSKCVKTLVQVDSSARPCTAREAQCARAVEESPPCITARARTRPTDSAVLFCCVVPPGGAGELVSFQTAFRASLRTQAGASSQLHRSNALCSPAHLTVQVEVSART